MAARYDHFHASYKEDDDILGEIEGGWTGYPDNWNDLSQDDKDLWWGEKCISWGMPRGAEIIKIWLAG